MVNIRQKINDGFLIGLARIIAKEKYDTRNQKKVGFVKKIIHTLQGGKKTYGT